MTEDENHTAPDPVCGKLVDVLRARAVGIFGGVTYYFCSPECKSRYADPRRAARTVSADEGNRRASPAPAATDLALGGEVEARTPATAASWSVAKARSVVSPAPPVEVPSAGVVPTTIQEEILPSTQARSPLRWLLIGLAVALVGLVVLLAR